MTKLRPFTCSFCGKTFTSSGYQKIHERDVCPVVKNKTAGIKLEQQSIQQKPAVSKVEMEQPTTMIKPKELEVQVEKSNIIDNPVETKPKPVEIISNKEIATDIKVVEQTKKELDIKEAELQALKTNKELSDKERLVELKDLKADILNLKKELNEQIKELKDKLDKTDGKVTNTNVKLEQEKQRVKRTLVQIFGGK